MLQVLQSQGLIEVKEKLNKDSMYYYDHQITLNIQIDDVTNSLKEDNVFLEF